jgi:hypothetical protein
MGDGLSLALRREAIEIRQLVLVDRGIFAVDRR